MPYNSSAFEAQLAKYKNAKIVKDVADLPDDRHRPQTRIKTESGRISPNPDTHAQTPHSLKTLREAKMEIPEGMMLVHKKKTSKAGKFVLLFMIGCLAVAGVKQRDKVEAMLASITASTGVTVQSVDTSAAISSMGANIGGGDLMRAMKDAQDKAAAVASQGPAQSMKYIQEETKRLQDMAKNIGATSGVVTTTAPIAPQPGQPAVTPPTQ